MLKILHKFSPNQPRVPAGQPGGGQWAGDASGDDGASVEGNPLLHQVRGPLPGGAPTFGQGIVGAITSLFGMLSSQNSDEQTAALVFRAQEYTGVDDPEKPPLYTGVLTRDQTDQTCPRHVEVQQSTSRTARQVRLEGVYDTAQRYGTEVHKRLAYEINGPGGYENPRDRNFRAEYSLLKEREARYGEPGSVRVDVFENLNNGTICVYDIKTGASSFSGARMGEIAVGVGLRYPTARRIIVIETRP